jgi:nucleoside-diphosphate-sugar epimerase
MPRVLIAGCGYVGTATANLFHEDGWQVEGWTSSPESAGELQAMPFRIRPVNISDSNAVAAAGGEFDAVICCVSSRGGDADDYRRIYLTGIRNLTASFSKSLLIFTSSTSVYAQRNGEWVTEESAAEPEAQTARVLRESERSVLGNGGIVARLAGIYGPGRSALLRKFLAGEDIVGSNPDSFINQVHRDDVAAALLSITRAAVGGNLAPQATEQRVFNVSDDHPISRLECFAWLAAHLQPQMRVASVATQRRRGNSNKRVSSVRLQALGWVPRFPTFEVGMTESVLPHAGLRPRARQ